MVIDGIKQKGHFGKTCLCGVKEDTNVLACSKKKNVLRTNREKNQRGNQQM